MRRPRHPPRGRGPSRRSQRGGGSGPPGRGLTAPTRRVVVTHRRAGCDLRARQQVDQRRGPADPARCPVASTIRSCRRDGAGRPGRSAVGRRVGRAQPQRSRERGDSSPVTIPKTAPLGTAGRRTARPGTGAGPGAGRRGQRRVHGEHQRQGGPAAAGHRGEVDGDQRMVDETGTHTGTVGAIGRPSSRRSRRADPTAQQDRRAAVGARSEDHAVASRSSPPASGPLVRGRATSSIRSTRAGRSRGWAEHEPAPGGSARCSSGPVPHVAGQRADAQGARAVVVCDRWDGPQRRRREEARGHGSRAAGGVRRPVSGRRRRAIRRNRHRTRHRGKAGTARRRPTRGCPRRPGVVVGRPAAHQEAPLVAEQPPTSLARGTRSGPAARRARRGSPSRDRASGRPSASRREAILRRVVRARLDQQDAADPRAEAGGQHAARRPGTHDDNVNSHRAPHQLDATPTWSTVHISHSTDGRAKIGPPSTTCP